MSDIASPEVRARLFRLFVGAIVRLRATPARPSQIVAEAEVVLSRGWADWSTREVEEALTWAVDENDDIIEDRIGRIFSKSSVGRSFWERERYAAKLSDLADLLAATESPGNGGTRRKQVQLLLRHDLLSAKEEVALARRVQRGDVAARNRLVEMNLRLAWSWVQRTRLEEQAAIDPEDLLQQATLGLVRAAEKFDAGKGFKFSTYASWWIKQAIQRSMADTSRTIRVPVHVDDRLRKIYTAEEKLWRCLGREPTADEIAFEAGLTPEHVREAQAIPVTIPLDDCDADTLDDPAAPLVEDVVLEGMGTAEVAQALEMLPPRSREVLSRRLGLDGEPPETLDAIGYKIGVTRERVRQLETDALKLLKVAWAPAIGAGQMEV